jgi:SAM-dependent methyltransferase
VNDLLATALAGALARAKGPRARLWLTRCAGWEGPLPAAVLADDDELDRILDAVWRSRSEAERRLLGQVFTPRPVARQLLLEVGEVAGGVLDPACGGGIFLVEAARLLAARGRARGLGPQQLAREVLEQVHGIDIEPDTARLARLMLGLEVVEILGAQAEDCLDELPLPSVDCRDATEAGALDALRGRVGAVVGNPPYREAKGMGSRARDQLRARFGAELSGAFDVYLCFVLLGLELVGEEGRVGLVLPNKFLVARYASELRARLAQSHRLHALLDLSELDVFGRVGVYPVLVVLGPPTARYKSCFGVDRPERLGQRPLPGLDVDSDLPGRLVPQPVWFTPPSRELCGLLERLTDQPRLGAVATARSTCSFHAKGLRERYVLPSDVLPDGLPYLGGLSFNRRNEIQPYRVHWHGFRIRYAEEELRAIGNPLPPLARFQQPKLVICQHARSGIAWFDEEGRFITKDVYPIVLGREPDPELVAALAAVLNSRVFSVLYAILYRGIAIGGGYLHFLPVFLHAMPVPDLSAPVRSRLADDVRALQQDPSSQRAHRLDSQVAELYGLSDAEHEAVIAFAGRLGFGEDLLSRR